MAKYFLSHLIECIFVAITNLKNHKMEALKILLSFFIGVVVGFGFWYLIFWFITNESNLFLWHWLTKTIYLVFSFSSLSGIISALLKEY